MAINSYTNFLLRKCIMFSKKRMLLIVPFLLVVEFLFLLVLELQSHKVTTNVFQPSRQHYLKSILLWVSPERLEAAVFGVGHSAFITNGCEFSDCEIVNYHKYRSLDSFDAVIFNLNDQFVLENVQPFDFIRNNRKRSQRFIFFTQEPPESLKIYDPSVYMQDFNWTMSYRLDSDIRLLYGRILPKPSISKTFNKDGYNQVGHRKIKRIHKKKKLVAWMVSHCITSGGREEYVKQLSQHIDVDIYGNCGNLTCDWRQPLMCYKMIEANYKFYLSFENSICTDYVTEKFFFILKYTLVPIVYGGANYSRIAPPHSYIDARQFRPKELAAYLKKLDANDSLYSEYLSWKKHYIVESGIEQMARHGFCDLCKKLHQDQEEKSYFSDLVTQWHYRTQCI